MSVYVTAEQITESVGVRPADFKLESTEALEALLDRWSAYVKGQIDDHCGVDFLEEAGGILADVHPTITGVAEQAVARVVNIVRSHRDSAMIRIDEWRVAIDLVDEVLPRHMRETLDRHMRSRARSGQGRFGFLGWVSHG